MKLERRRKKKYVRLSTLKNVACGEEQETGLRQGVKVFRDKWLLSLRRLSLLQAKGPWEMTRFVYKVLPQSDLPPRHFCLHLRLIFYADMHTNLQTKSIHLNIILEGKIYRCILIYLYIHICQCVCVCVCVFINKCTFMIPSKLMLKWMNFVIKFTIITKTLLLFTCLKWLRR